MNTERFQLEPNAETNPICKFGPGGEYVAFWQGRAAKKSSCPAGPIGKVLAALGEMIGATIQPGVLGDTEPKNLESSSKVDFVEEKLENETGSKPSYTLPAPRIETCGRISGQSMLFTQHSGTGRRPRCKTQYRIRTYRQPAGKGTSLCFARQGSLFDADPRCAKTA